MLTIVYGICAAVAGTIFLIQLVLSLAGHDGRLWVVGEYGMLACSQDQGVTWDVADLPFRGCL